MVDIYLSVHGERIRLLSIPLRDVQRLSIRPFKWLRFVMFCICGAKGQLSAMPDGLPVDYDTGITSLTDNDIYYYMAGETFIFIDPYCLDEQMTSTADTPRSPIFRSDIMARDGESCIVTGVDESHCDAAHLMPKCKSDEYAQKVVEDRSPLYGSQSTISGINDVVNGVLVSKLLHSQLSSGAVAFLKTPGFGLEAADIPRYDRGSTGTDCLTLHRLEEPPEYDAALLQLLPSIVNTPRPQTCFGAGANVDALFCGTLAGNSPPPSPVILDYVYGVAAYTLWGVGRMDGMIEEYFKLHYKPILQRRINPPCHNGDDDDDDDCLDDPKDADYPESSQTSTVRGHRLVKAMDELNMILMYLNGISPQEAAKRWEKRVEQEAWIAQEASRPKVLEWMKTMDVNSS